MTVPDEAATVDLLRRQHATVAIPNAPARPMCLGRCGYALTSPLARERGFGHRCWAKLTDAARDAITAALRPKPPRIPRPRSAAHIPGQLTIADLTTGADR